MEIITRKEAIEQGLKRYFTGKPCKHGHVSERSVGGRVCVDCTRIRALKSKVYHGSYYEKNRDEILKKKAEYKSTRRRELNDKQKVYNANNKEKISEQRRLHRLKNKDELSKKKQRYYLENKTKIRDRQDANKDQINKAAIARYHRIKHDRDFVLKRAMRGCLYRLIKSTGCKKNNKTEVEVGYTQEQFKLHIESQFKEGMSWENRSEWHIDHIKPIKAFLDEGITDPAIVNALDNLQPLWAHENLSKGTKWHE